MTAPGRLPAIALIYAAVLIPCLGFVGVRQLIEIRRIRRAEIEYQELLDRVAEYRKEVELRKELGRLQEALNRARARIAVKRRLAGFRTPREFQEALRREDDERIRRGEEPLDQHRAIAIWKEKERGKDRERSREDEKR